MTLTRLLMLGALALVATSLVSVVFLSDYYGNDNHHLWRRRALSSATVAATTTNNMLQFRRTTGSANNMVFKILQVADIHLGESFLADVGTFLVLDEVVGTEKPDLIILSGDQITANNIDKNASSYYRELGKKLETYGVPWAVIFGNHDDAPFQIGLPGGVTAQYPAKTSRRQLLRVCQEFPHSLTQAGPLTLFGASNYVLHVNDGKSGAPAAQILLLDSGGGSLPEKLTTSQILWFQQQVSRTLPVVVFQHIPANTKDFGFVPNRCNNALHADGVAPLGQDPGIVQALVQAGNVHFLAVGHNHGNDYCCPILRNNSNNTKKSLLHACFGRHSGYGGYGTWGRGVRVYQLQLSQQGTFSWSSWVRMAITDAAIDYYRPSA